MVEVPSPFPIPRPPPFCWLPGVPIMTRSGGFNLGFDVAPQQVGKSKPKLNPPIRVIIGTPGNPQNGGGTGEGEGTSTIIFLSL